MGGLTIRNIIISFVVILILFSFFVLMSTFTFTTSVPACQKKTRPNGWMMTKLIDIRKRYKDFDHKTLDITKVKNELNRNNKIKNDYKLKTKKINGTNYLYFIPESTITYCHNWLERMIYGIEKENDKKWTYEFRISSSHCGFEYRYSKRNTTWEKAEAPSFKAIALAKTMNKKKSNLAQKKVNYIRNTVQSTLTCFNDHVSLNSVSQKDMGRWLVIFCYLKNVIKNLPDARTIQKKIILALKHIKESINNSKMKKSQLREHINDMKKELELSLNSDDSCLQVK